jgi:transcriptional regulator with XRE-family HTH domain
MLAIGKKMRELRSSKGWTLAQLAKQCGIALSSLSRIETGRMTGTLESHLQIAKALGVRLVELYADVDPAAPLIEHHRGNSASPNELLTAKGVMARLLTTGSLRKKMLPALVSVPPGKATHPEHAAAGTEKFLYLLKGKLRVSVGKEEFLLQPGDSLYFQASLSHSLKNAGGPLLALSVTCPPAL